MGAGKDTGFFVSLDLYSNSCEHLVILITHLGNIAVPVPMFNSHPSLPWFFDNAVPFTVLGETEGCVHGRKTPGQLSSLPSLGFVADIFKLWYSGWNRSKHWVMS